MEIEIRLYATFRKYLPPGSGTFGFQTTAEEGATVGDIVRELSLPDEIPRTIIMNGNHVGEDRVLVDGDVVNIFPPVAGG